MSTTLGVLLGRLMPDTSITIFERGTELAGESSAPWNNAGTGHAGLCELNYMPDPDDASTTLAIAQRFQISCEFWTTLVEDGDLSSSFSTPVPHMDVVFGEFDVDYLRRRFLTLKEHAFFEEMEYTEDAELIRRWAPLLMEGRSATERVAATRSTSGIDVDFGALALALARAMKARGAKIHTSHEVTGLTRTPDGMWRVSGRNLSLRSDFHVKSKFVFVGAGGYALRLLQKSAIPEVRGYGVFPLGAEFLRTDKPHIVTQHNAKVYGKAARGAPPMSLPHLDKRAVDGHVSLMFGPYATFSTRLLKHGRLRDLFTTVTLSNLPVLLSVGLKNFPLVRYLISQLLSPRRRKFEQLRKYYPGADTADWYPIQAGQRAQLIKPASKVTGELMFGTEIIAGADGTIAGVLGASPGASVAPSMMLDVIEMCFPDTLEKTTRSPLFRR